jgi:hypothetical protein
MGPNKTPRSLAGWAQSHWPQGPGAFARYLPRGAIVIPKRSIFRIPDSYEFPRP